MKTRSWQMAYRQARKVVVAVVGGTVILIGLALLILPGPAFVVLPLGLAILGIEFAWASRWLGKLRSGVAAVQNRRARKDARRENAVEREPVD